MKFDFNHELAPTKFCTLKFNGVSFKTQLHFIYYMKAMLDNDTKLVSDLANAKDMKSIFNLSRECKLPFPQYLNVLPNLLSLSYRMRMSQNKEFYKLIKSLNGDEVLEYDNPDKFLGGEGNLVGKVLMQLRSEVQSQ